MVLTVVASNGTVTYEDLIVTKYDELKIMEYKKLADGGYYIGDIYNGETKLTKVTHYTETGGKVTLLKAYLETLTEADYTIKIETSQGNVTAIVKVVDTTEEV